MTKLPRNVKPHRLIRAFERIGFSKVGQKGSHVRMKHPDGRWTQIPVHSKPIPVGTLRRILQQTEVSQEELKDLK